MLYHCPEAMLESPSRELAFDSMLGRLFFCSFRRVPSALFDRVRALLLLCRLMGGAFRGFGSVEKVPGCKISKPVPCPRRIVESRLSKDERGGGVCFAGVGAASGRLWRELCSLSLGREILLLLPMLLMLLAGLAGRERGETGAVKQNWVKGVTSGRLDLRTAGGRLSI